MRGPGFGGDIEKEETGLNKCVQKDPVAASFFLASWARSRNCKLIKEFHIKPETMKFIEAKGRESLENMGTGEKLLNRTSIVCAVRSRINKWDHIKLQSFYKAKDTVNDTKRPPTDWERIFTILNQIGD